MNPTKQQAFEKISSLVERFREHLEEYKRGIYNEHQKRVILKNYNPWTTYCEDAIVHAERRIDELVYELYGLSEEEVAIIEKQ